MENVTKVSSSRAQEVDKGHNISTFKISFLMSANCLKSKSSEDLTCNLLFSINGDKFEG